MRVMLSNGTSFGADTQWGQRTASYTVGAMGFQLADFNGDGRPDLIYDGSGGYLHVLLNVNGAGFGADTIWGVRSQVYNSNDAGFRVGDVNGDGLPDVVYDAAGGYMYVLLNTGNGSFAPDKSWGLRVSTINTNGLGFKLVDMNGDGLADVIYDSTDVIDMHVMLSNGASFGTDTQWGTRTTSYNANALGFQLDDVNGDGLTDLIYDNSGNMRVLLNMNGASFGTDTLWGTRTASYNANAMGFQMVDLNGDGVMDLIYDGSSSMNALTSTGTNDGIVLSLTNGLGANSAFVYKPLTDSTVYTKDTGANAAVYPVQDVLGPMYVVASETRSNGIGGTFVKNYSYAGAKNHLTGGGFLGFRNVTGTDVQTGISITNTIRQDYPNQGLSASALSVSSSGMMLSQSSYTWSFTTNSAWSAQYHVSLLTQSNETSYGLASNGTQQGALIVQKTTCKTYDAYANATYIGVWSTNVVNCASPPAKTGLFVNETANTYLNDTTNWFLGRLTGSTVTSTTP
jgi:hypothetical protein